MRTHCFTLVFCIAGICVVMGQNWPQAAGPIGDWSTSTEGAVPAEFNVATGVNVAWTNPLVESGQSGLTVWGDRIYLSVLKPFGPEATESRKTASIVALCLDAESGETIWTYEIETTNLGGYLGGFSEGMTPTPITDGEPVWFTNAGGKMVCLNWAGELVWERVWRMATEVLKPEKAFSFNKQFESFMVDDLLVQMESSDREDGAREHGWHSLYGLDKKTGAVRWISEDSLTHYNTSGYSRDALSRPTAMIGQGGHHAVPELPKGYSMIDLSNGKRIWQTDLTAQVGTATYNAAFTADYAVCLSDGESEVTVLDSHPQNDRFTLQGGFTPLRSGDGETWVEG
jgi:outer membrane protein assembly factor BamB